MPPRTKRTQSHTVSLFTREWIEIISVSVNISGGAVSLFTREWIEMQMGSKYYHNQAVSLFTREWIEMQLPELCFKVAESPSLRGSGLK